VVALLAQALRATSQPTGVAVIGTLHPGLTSCGFEIQPFTADTAVVRGFARARRKPWMEESRVPTESFRARKVGRKPNREFFKLRDHPSTPCNSMAHPSGVEPETF